MVDRIRQTADRWRLTLIGVPLLGVAAAIVGGLHYVAFLVPLSAIALGVVDLYVHSSRKGDQDEVDADS